MRLFLMGSSVVVLGIAFFVTGAIAFFMLPLILIPGLTVYFVKKFVPSLTPVFLIILYVAVMVVSVLIFVITTRGSFRVSFAGELLCGLPWAACFCYFFFLDGGDNNSGQSFHGGYQAGRTNTIGGTGVSPRVGTESTFKSNDPAKQSAQLMEAISAAERLPRGGRLVIDERRTWISLSGYETFLKRRPDLSVCVRYEYMNHSVESVIPAGIPVADYIGKKNDKTDYARLIDSFAGQIIG